MSSQDNSFYGQTFGADDLSFLGINASKHPRISKQSPFYQIHNKPQSAQKAQLRISSPNKENRVRYQVKPVLLQRLSTSPAQNQQTNYKEICQEMGKMIREQKRLYEMLLVNQGNRNNEKLIRSQLECLDKKLRVFTKQF